MIGRKQDPAALLRIMIQGIEPVDLPLAASLSVRLAARRAEKARVSALCDELVEELERLADAAARDVAADPIRETASTALARLEAALN